MNKSVPESLAYALIHLSAFWSMRTPFHGENSILQDLSNPRVTTTSVPFPGEQIRKGIGGGLNNTYIQTLFSTVSFTDDHDVELVISYYSEIIGLNLKSGHSSVYLDSHAILGIDYTLTCDNTYKLTVYFKIKP